MAGLVDVNIDFGAIHDLGYDDAVEDLEMEIAEGVVEVAQSLAPRLTGAGAESIRAERGTDGESSYVDVGWDAAHDYLRFREFGTEHELAVPFLRPAGDSAHL